jgi:hypothetical protein
VSPLLFLREDQLAVEMDLEDAARALDQRRLEAERSLQMRRQTGGARQVVSNPAVLDRDAFLHIHLLDGSFYGGTATMHPCN